MTTPACSVIIPTYNRVATLNSCLGHLTEQDIGPSRLQVIVIDDGSSDETIAVVEALSHPFGSLSMRTQANAGPGAARNNGLALALAPFVLFINDDTLLGPRAISAHLEAHATHPGSMVLGTFDFVPEFAATPLGRILSETPHLFSYPLFGDGDELSADLAATCNLSVPTLAAQSAGFDPRYAFAAEDVDFALRLQDEGFVLRHSADAQALHDHHLTVEDLKRTALLRGFGAARLALKRGVSDNMLRHVRQTAFSEGQNRHALDQAVAVLNAELGMVSPTGPFTQTAYRALADIFRLGNLLGYLDEPALIQAATRQTALVS